MKLTRARPDSLTQRPYSLATTPVPHYSELKLGMESHKVLSLSETQTFVVVPCPICTTDTALVDMCEVWGARFSSLVTSFCMRCSHVFHKRRPERAWYEIFYADRYGPTDERLREGRTDPLNARYRFLKTLSVFRRGRRFVLSLSKVASIYPELIQAAEEARTGVGEIQRVLDIGCGTGNTLMQLGLVGFEGYGIDASVHRVELAKRNSRCPVVLTPVEELQVRSFGTRFDLIIGHHVLEHLFDPNEFFLAARRVLNDGGVVCLAVPNVYKSSLLAVFHTIAHPQAFTPESLTRLVHKHGFAIDRFTVGDEVQVVARLKGDATASDECMPPVESSGGNEFLERQLQDLLAEPCRKYQFRTSYSRDRHGGYCIDPNCANGAHLAQSDAGRPTGHDAAVVEVMTPPVRFPIRIVNPDSNTGAVWVK